MISQSVPIISVSHSDLTVSYCNLTVSHCNLTVSHSDLIVSHSDLRVSHCELIHSQVSIVSYSTRSLVCILQSWSFYASDSCEDVWLQVWRPTGGDYQLVGQNYFYSLSNDPDCNNTSAEKNVSHPVADNKQIPVQPGDVIGWSVRGSLGQGAGQALSLTQVRPA